MGIWGKIMQFLFWILEKLSQAQAQAQAQNLNPDTLPVAVS